ncbi:MAG: hypothetical protein LBU11_04925 [Zoogloeaceae bacterium]|jgi:hypothetical protein|nr:hypothetical protein [Zoogloeaceae bacterium]
MPDGKLICVSGASRSGKTVYVMRSVASARRIVVWDVEAQWCEIPGFRRVSSRAALVAAAQAPGDMRLAYVEQGDIIKGFDLWSGCVLYAGRYVEPLTAVAEEVADVTSSARAPGNWGMLLRRGLKRGINIYAISQRWQEADKTALGNASGLVVFRATTRQDAEYIASRAGAGAEDVWNLRPLEYMRVATHTREIERGVLTF